MMIDQVCYYFSGGSSTLSSRLEMAYVYQVPQSPTAVPNSLFKVVLGIRIRKRLRIHMIRMFLGLPDPDPLVKGTNPATASDPSPFS
jgi:hypothetical protein